MEITAYPRTIRKRFTCRRKFLVHGVQCEITRIDILPDVRKAIDKAMATEQQKREEEIERLARETGRLIREANPETREELREAASAIMREEAQEVHEPAAPEARRSMNPLAAGLGLLVIGAGLAFIMPPVGLGLLVIGALAIIWGAIMSAIRK